MKFHAILPKTIGLHLGAGKHPMPGWFNTDLNEDQALGIVALDAAKPFPFADGSFPFVFSEHMIEHVPYESGSLMIRECFRVLRPGGRIRIATPDFRFLVDLYLGSSRGIRERYVRWATEKFIPSADSFDPIFVVNNFVRNWGHKFIYDEELLSGLMESSGFTDVCRWKVGESPTPALRTLENVNRMPSGFLELESMVLEAQKPLTEA